MAVCGPKLSLCGLILSVWGIIQLVSSRFRPPPFKNFRFVPVSDGRILPHPRSGARRRSTSYIARRRRKHHSLLRGNRPGLLAGGFPGGFEGVGRDVKVSSSVPERAELLDCGLFVFDHVGILGTSVLVEQPFFVERVMRGF